MADTGDDRDVSVAVGQMVFRAYDVAAMGWTFTALPSGQDAESDPTQKKLIYDTTKLGYSSAGHTYGDALTSDDRAAVVEYLKTL